MKYGDSPVNTGHMVTLPMMFDGWHGLDRIELRLYL